MSTIQIALPKRSNGSNLEGNFRTQLRPASTWLKPGTSDAPCSKSDGFSFGSHVLHAVYRRDVFGFSRNAPTRMRGRKLWHRRNQHMCIKLFWQRYRQLDWLSYHLFRREHVWLVHQNSQLLPWLHGYERDWRCFGAVQHFLHRWQCSDKPMCVNLKSWDFGPAIWPFEAPFIKKPNLKGWRVGQTPCTSPNWVHAAGVKSFASWLLL